MSNSLIWGASGGIGQALLRALTQRGDVVGGVSRHPDDLVGLTDFRYEADVADAFAVQRAVYAAAQDLAPVNLWIYTIGDITARPVADTDPAAWRRIVDANLTGAFLATHYSTPLLADDAHLIFVGAYSERLRLPGLAAYAAAKAGLEAFVAALAKEERRRRVTLVRPGAVDTPLWAKMPVRLPRTALTPDDLAQRILAFHEAGSSGILDA
jgi:NAD(P)-dependent dehydrogenase (short-subunit alcohol dehydrogenase family)